MKNLKSCNSKDLGLNSFIEGYKAAVDGKLLEGNESAEFKEGYKEKRNELMSLFKKDKKAVLKRLYDMGLITPETIMTLDKRSIDLYNELVADGEIK